MSVLDLYGVSALPFNVSLAIQHLVPALPVRNVVCPWDNRLLMPKSASLAFPLTSGEEIKQFRIHEL